MKLLRTPSKYKGQKIKLKETSKTFLDLQEENKSSSDKDESTSIIIEDWTENVLGKTTVFIKDTLYGHLDQSNLARIVGLDELELD